MQPASQPHDMQPIAPAINGLPPSTQHPSLPSSSSASENNTPIPSGSAASQSKKPTAKRKRTTDGASDSADGSAPAPRTRDGPKKKKANRACFHCQKAHLTCDDSRPCQRCIKRGMADNCTEGHRKKAKYLLDDEELEALKRAKSGEGSSKVSETTTVPPQRPPHEQAVPPTQYISPEAMFPAYQAPAQYGIPAEAANLEYSILSAILGGSPDSGSGGSPATTHAQQATVPNASYAPTQSSGLASTSWPAEAIPGQYAPAPAAGSQGYAGASAQGYGEPQPPLAIQPSDTTLPASSAGGIPPEYIAPAATTGYPAAAPAAVPYPQQAGQGGGLQYPEYSADQSQAQVQDAAPGAPPAVAAQVGTGTGTGAYATPGAPPSPTSSFLSRPRRNPSSPTAVRLVPNWTTGSSLCTPNGTEGAVQSVYKSVTKGYDYTQGYHFLMKHLSRRFEKNDILRIVRALPSFIALQMPMTEEDEVFVEKCFQRSLIELDKLVSFSGTPTVAWRRTGEICLVGPEFCMLTGWEKEELIGRRKYIYELFENQSVVEYWENFANHAFENTTQSVYSHCVLLKPSGAPVPCTFCFSIRRDIMDLPSLVIGQWLPLL